MSRVLTQEEYKTALVMHAGGVSSIEIGEEFGVPSSNIRSMIRKVPHRYQMPTFEEMNLSSLPDDVLFEHIDFQIP